MCPRLLALTLLAGPLLAAEPGRDDAVVRRNIFRHSFDKPIPPRPPVRRPPPPRVIVLTGIMRFGDGFVAVFEEKAVGSVRFLDVGDQLDKAKVVSITDSAVVLEEGGAERPVELGETITGKPAPAGVPSTPTPTPASASASAAPQPATPPAPAPAPKALPQSLKERIEAMRRRRQQQLGK